MMMGCRKCMLVSGLLFLVAGVLFLLQDLGVWSFWNLNWWTVLFVLMGVGALGKRTCADCCEMTYGKKK